jgi:hypothetical protein
VYHLAGPLGGPLLRSFELGFLQRQQERRAVRPTAATGAEFVHVELGLNRADAPAATRINNRGGITVPSVKLSPLLKVVLPFLYNHWLSAGGISYTIRCV